MHDGLSGEHQMEPEPALWGTLAPPHGYRWSVVAPDDWRRQGQERYLAARELRWTDWSPIRPDWDHDHCEFCWAKFGPADADGTDHAAGFVTADDDHHWICSECFEAFRAEFAWTLAAS
jgi:hypothetical protein